MVIYCKEKKKKAATHFVTQSHKLNSNEIAILIYSNPLGLKHRSLFQQKIRQQKLCYRTQLFTSLHGMVLSARIFVGQREPFERFCRKINQLNLPEVPQHIVKAVRNFKLNLTSSVNEVLVQ